MTITGKMPKPGRIEKSIGITQNEDLYLQQRIRK